MLTRILYSLDRQVRSTHIKKGLIHASRGLYFQLDNVGCSADHTAEKTYSGKTKINIVGQNMNVRPCLPDVI